LRRGEAEVWAEVTPSFNELFWTVFNYAILVAVVAATIWVWRDARARKSPWAPTWALATLVAFPVAFPGYLLSTRGRR